MKKRKTYSIILASILILSMVSIFSSTASAEKIKFTIRGYVFVDGNLTTPDSLTITFEGEPPSIVNITTGVVGYYIYDVPEEEGKEVGLEGVFKITIDSKTYQPVTNFVILPEVYQYLNYNFTILISDCTDTNPPEKVTGLTVTDAKDGKLSLTWLEPLDEMCGFLVNKNIGYYKIYRDGVFIKNLTSTSYQDKGLTNGQEYCYKVQAVDNSGNIGENSTEACKKPTASSSGGGGGGPSGGDIPSNSKPVADADGPYQGFTDEVITLDGSGSTDLDGDIVSYEWDLDSDGNYDDATGVTTSYSWSLPGEYTIGLQVKDSIDQTDMDSTTVTILQANRPPENLTIDGPTEGLTETEYNFTISATDEDTNNTIFFVINWGDGTNTTTESFNSGIETINGHIWSSSGTYTIIVIAYDNTLATSESVTHTITITESPTEEQKQEDNTLLYLAAIILIILFLLLLLLAGKKKKKVEEKPKKQNKSKKK